MTVIPIHKAVPERKFGALRGKLVVSDTFFEPLHETDLVVWE
jgi:hypothetical protein